MTSSFGHACTIFRLPSAIAEIRSQDLPGDVSRLLKTMSDQDALEEMMAQENVDSPEQAIEIVEFYVEQILLHAQGDAYRTLGGDSSTPRSTLRSNMALLLNWLHPDRNFGEERTVYVARVTAAWDQVKTPERREEYDAANNRPANAQAAASATNANVSPAMNVTGRRAVRRPANRVMVRPAHPGLIRLRRRRNPLRFALQFSLLSLLVLSISTYFIWPDEMLLVTENAWADFRGFVSNRIDLFWNWN